MYFSKCNTIEDVKKTFKEWAKKLHPDAGGNAEAFKSMMNEYEDAFERLKNVHQGKDGVYEKEANETAWQFAEIINRIIHMEGTKIEVIGSWVWISGNTFAYKEELKELGFFWSKSKKSWYYNGDERKSRKSGHYDMDGLRERWGTTEVKAVSRVKIAG